jgi:hypothetical protein
MSVVNNNLLLTADAGVSQYQISRSLRLNRPDTAFLSRVPGVAGNRTTWSFCCWVKRSNISTNQTIFCTSDATANTSVLYFTSSNNLEFYELTSGSYVGRKVTSAVYRDSSAWAHVMAVWNTANTTASDRMQLYVNGQRITSFGISVDPSINANSRINTTVEHDIARVTNISDYFLDAYLADVHFIDGQALTPSAFTETNATTGQLVPKAYTGTYGTNGYRLNFSDNSAATAATLGADSSGNGNNWTPNNLSVTNSFLGGNNGTLVNGPTYSSANGGSLVFDGTNDYVSGSIPTLNNWSITLWYRSTDITSQIVFYPFSGTTGANGLGFGGTFDVNTNNRWYFFDGTNNFSSSNTAVTTNVWYYLVVTKSSTTYNLYTNGSLSLSGSGVDLSLTQYNLGRRFDGGGMFYVKGNIAQASVYNRALSASEISKNYNALVGRFGGTSSGSIVTSGLVLNLDAGNTASYPGTGTTWTDISTRLNADTDSLTDTPTSYGTDTGAGAEVRGNYCTWNPLDNMSHTLTDGNLRATGASSFTAVNATLAVSSGKWYWEVTAGSAVDTVGIWSTASSATDFPGGTSDSFSYNGNGGQKYTNRSSAGYGASYTTGDVVGVALDMDAKTLTFYKNGVSQGLAYSGFTGSFRPCVRAGADGTPSTGTFGNFGQRPFAYAAPSGFKALCDTNIPEGTITTSGTFTGNANANGPFVYLNGVPTAMTINSNAVTFGTQADKLANGFKVRSSSGSYNTAGSNTYSITTTGAKFKYARAQPNP